MERSRDSEPCTAGSATLRSLERSGSYPLDDEAIVRAHGSIPVAPLVAAIPISLRIPGEGVTYGNRISVLLVHLPVHLASPVERLLALKHDAVASRQLHTRLGVGALGEWAEFTSARLLGIAARFYATESSPAATGRCTTWSSPTSGGPPSPSGPPGRA